MKHALELSEEDRQAVLLALAALSVERPGWLDYLQRIARRIDPELSMFEGFRKLRSPEPAGPIGAVAGETEVCDRCGDTWPTGHGWLESHRPACDGSPGSGMTPVSKFT